MTVGKMIKGPGVAAIVLGNGQNYGGTRKVQAKIVLLQRFWGN